MALVPEPAREPLTSPEFEPGIQDGADPSLTVTWIGFADGDDEQVAPFAGVDQAAFSTVPGLSGAEGSGTGEPQPAPSSASPLAAGDPAHTSSVPDQGSDLAQPAQSQDLSTSQPPTEETAALLPETPQQDTVPSPDPEAIQPPVQPGESQPSLDEGAVALPVDDQVGVDTPTTDTTDQLPAPPEQQALESPAQPEPAPSAADVLQPADPLTAQESPSESLPAVQHSESDPPQPLQPDVSVPDGAPGLEGAGGTPGAVKDPMAALADIDTAAASSIRVNSDMWKSGRPIAREGMVIKPYPLLRHIVRDSADTLFSLGGTGGVQRNPIVAVQFDRRGKVGRVEILRWSGLAALDEKYLASWMARWTAVDPRLAKLKDGELTNPIVFRLIFVPESDDARPGPAPDAGK